MNMFMPMPSTAMPSHLTIKRKNRILISRFSAPPVVLLLLCIYVYRRIQEFKYFNPFSSFSFVIFPLSCYCV